jgi:hypothetical protein
MFRMRVTSTRASGLRVQEPRIGLLEYDNAADVIYTLLGD